MKGIDFYDIIIYVIDRHSFIDKCLSVKGMIKIETK